MGLPTYQNLYGYSPSQPVAIIVTLFYAGVAVYHLYLSIIRPCQRDIRHKHRLTILLFVAALISTAGYAFRIASIKKPDSIAMYAMSSSYIVIAPIFVCATLYLFLSRLIQLCLPAGPAQAFLKLGPSALRSLFITSDVLSFLTQASGSGVAASGDWKGNKKDVGTGILIAGLALQLATFTLFMLVFGTILTRARKALDAGFNSHVRKWVLGMWIASIFVWVSPASIFAFCLLD
jgi:uncharacterized membrane protein